uniref:Uncharacterized protein n=1 Tax=Moniliophthora roreri TaxID=221103 RepID=A0A0W0G1C0_MONRR
MCNDIKSPNEPVSINARHGLPSIITTMTIGFGTIRLIALTNEDVCWRPG